MQGQRILIHTGDITKLDVDAIVNAANTSLLGGGGVDGAIHRAAGRELEFECRMLNGCRIGEAKITKGYRLPARHIIHTVGPVWQGGAKREAKLLGSCYIGSLELAAANDCRAIGFPAISTGVYRYPKEQAAKIAVGTVSGFLEERAMPETVIFCCFDEAMAELYRRIVADIRGC